MKIIKQTSKKWSVSTQAYFLLKCGELLKEGFTLLEAISFLNCIMPKQAKPLNYLVQLLQAGRRLDEGLLKLGVHENIVSQIYLSQENGQFYQVLISCAQSMLSAENRRKKLRSLLIYPCILLLFVLFLLVGIRQFFLPQLENVLTTNQHSLFVNITFFVIQYFPTISLSLFGCVSISVYLGRKYYLRKSALMKCSFLVKIPIVKHWMSLYYTAYFSQELAHFYGNGYTLQQIVYLLKKGNTSRLLKEFAILIEANAELGRALSHVVLQLPFLKPEMAHIIEHGEKISQLSIKLMLYAKECLAQLEQDIYKKMTLIQPIVFLLVGIIVLLVYMTLMIPMLDMVDSLFVQ